MITEMRDKPRFNHPRGFYSHTASDRNYVPLSFSSVNRITVFPKRSGREGNKEACSREQANLFDGAVLLGIKSDD